jgi:hypothetical protein
MDREPGDAAITRPWGRPEVGERSWYAGISPVAARKHRQNIRVSFDSNLLKSSSSLAQRDRQDIGIQILTCNDRLYLACWVKIKYCIF